MENQNPPPFPFDGFDLPFDTESELAPTNVFPSSSRLTSEQRTVLEQVQRKLREFQEQLHATLSMVDRELDGMPRPSPAVRAPLSRLEPPPFAMPHPRPVDPISTSLPREEEEGARVLEGVFDGQNMVGPDGKQYSVPANYASKSKLVEGDILKLRITDRGAFVYKQIGPIARDRRIGVLERDDVTSEFVVIVPEHDDDRSELMHAVLNREDLPTANYRRYRVLRASVTYYRGAAGDEVVVLVPKDAPSTWGAVENIIKR